GVARTRTKHPAARELLESNAASLRLRLQLEQELLSALSIDARGPRHVLELQRAVRDENQRLDQTLQVRPGVLVGIRFGLSCIGRALPRQRFERSGKLGSLGSNLFTLFGDLLAVLGDRFALSGDLLAVLGDRFALFRNLLTVLGTLLVQEHLDPRRGQLAVFRSLGALRDIAFSVVRLDRVRLDRIR